MTIVNMVGGGSEGTIYTNYPDCYLFKCSAKQSYTEWVDSAYEVNRSYYNIDERVDMGVAKYEMFGSTVKVATPKITSNSKSTGSTKLADKKGTSSNLSGTYKLSPSLKQMFTDIINNGFKVTTITFSSQLYETTNEVTTSLDDSDSYIYQVRYNSTSYQYSSSSQKFTKTGITSVPSTITTSSGDWDNSSYAGYSTCIACNYTCYYVAVARPTSITIEPA